MFSSETYIDRRKRLAEQMQSGVVLIVGNDESAMNYPDNPYEFRQDSSFLYFFGLDSPGLVGLIDIDEGKDIIFGDDITIDDVIWMGPKPKLADRAQPVGITDTLPTDRLAGILADARGGGRSVHFLPQCRGDNIVKLHRLLSIPAAEINDNISVDLIKAVVEQRSVKSPEEVEELESAIEICHDMQTAAMKACKPGLVERQVAGLMAGLVATRGANLAFPTIFTTHGETLHNHYHGNVMQAGDIIINDSGAESALHYAGDITRTIPVSGTFTDRQKDVYTIILNAQTAAISSILPGVPFKDVHIFACEVLAAGLKDMGLMKGDMKQAVAAGAGALFFQCGLGHMIGLDVHDMEGIGEDYVGYTDTIKRDPQFGLRSLRLGRQLQIGFAVTVEPGLYFIPQLIDLWKAENKFDEYIDYSEVEKFKDFGGIRLEDEVLVTADGYRLLGKPIPRTIAEVEAACLA